jgi:apolipoprotein D and lipocalin family protein
MLWGVATGLVGCAAKQPSLPTVPHVDLQRFMGDWYVIANIPTWPEQNAYNAVESYALNADGTIGVTFTFNEGSFDGPRKEYHPKGFVTDHASNAIWGMQFVWPIKAEYLIVELDPAYTRTVIGRSSRDYVWLMARKPTVSAAEYDRFVQRIGSWGYDVSKLRRVPQRW